MIPSLIRDRVALLPPWLLPPAAYFAVAARYAAVSIDTGMRYDKRRKQTHRYAIASSDGPRLLTVPVSRPPGAFARGNLCWDRVEVSNHGRWWEVHRNAVDSVYGRSPFHEFYIDRLAPLWREPDGEKPLPVTRLATEAFDLLARVLIPRTSRLEGTAGMPADDFRQTDFGQFPNPAYWQMKPPFTPGLSALDLLFNLGPEAEIYLADDRFKNIL